ncbi:unnamed protein product [Microthlaspi erraticum]|uniref:Arabidopsis retrotransposon Orf1 C-terminal domain-containing protein n=1 Tax=Microthlaspi erraticum TaxID=1685480 RepID=A0A6D2HKU3_9BRAS|nr:unnamed protein product [Microthlaspi erraticum]
MNFRNRGYAGSSRRREEIARGQRPAVETDDDFVEDSTMRDAPFPETPGDDETEDAITADEMQRFRTLLDRGTMQTLRIDEDIDEMFQNLSEGDLPFLATLEHETCDPGKTTPDGSDGYIMFWATGRRHYLSYRDIDRALFLPPGNRLGLDVDRDEMSSLWGTIAFGLLLLKREVRSDQEPAGPLLPQGDRQHALFPTGHRERHRDRDGHDRRGTHRHHVETDQRDRAPRQQVLRRHHGRPCYPAPLLQGLGFEEQDHPAQRGRGRAPEWLDLEYLRNSVFLQKTSDASRLLYQFTHVQLGAPACCSPAPAGRRSEVGPTRVQPTSVCSLHRRSLDRQRLRHTSGDHTPRRPVTRARLHADRRARQTAGLKAAHQHIGILQRWNKAQDKITNKLKSKAIPSEDDDEPDHDTTGGRPLPPEPPRHSSFEPRQQRKRRFGEPHTARPSGAAAPADLPFRRCSSTSRPTAPTDHTPPMRAPPDQYVPYTTERAAPTTVPLHAGEHAGGSRRLHLRTPLMLSPDPLDRPPPLYHSIFPFLFLLLSLFNSLLGFFSHRVGVK